jgi:hypothetical protein
MSIRKQLLPILFIAFLSLLATSCGNSRRTLAIEEGWELLGESKVNFVRDRDAINVLTSTRYTAIRFKVENKDVHINDLNVIFQNGDKLSPTIDEDIAADQYSRIIEIGPEGKMLRSIDFKYRSTGNILKGRASVLVFGKRYTGY